VLLLPVLIGFGRESHGLTLRLRIQISADGREEWSVEREMRWLDDVAERFIRTPRGYQFLCAKSLWL
jgi:hypothetical protein